MSQLKKYFSEQMIVKKLIYQTMSLTGQYNTIQPTRRSRTVNIISPDSGTNPVEVGPVRLVNVRGQLMISVISGDNGYTSSFEIVGGVGESPNAHTLDWYHLDDTITGGTIMSPATNTIVFTTDAADAGGREYTIVFNPYMSYGPTIQLTNGATLGNNTLTVIAVRYIPSSTLF